MQCNCCGRELITKQNVVMEDYITIKKDWGYFSEKDGVTEEFLLCEKCVIRIEKMFAIPAHTYNTNELI